MGLEASVGAWAVEQVGAWAKGAAVAAPAVEQVAAPAVEQAVAAAEVWAAVPPFVAETYRYPMAYNGDT